MTYRALDVVATRLAQRLRTLGVSEEVAVATILDRSFQQIGAALAVMKAGGAFLPLDPRWPVERLSQIISEAGIEVAIGNGRAPAGSPSDLVFVEAEGVLEEADAANTLSPPRSGQLAYIIYTSGSTGRPKGVEVTHANLMNFLSWRWRQMAISPSDRSSHLASVSFDASIAEVWPALTAGASVVIAPEKVKLPSSRLKDWMVAEGVTLATFVPPLLATSMISSDWPEESRIRIMMSAGDTLHTYPSPTLPFTFMNGYGPTEGTVETTTAVLTSQMDQTAPPPIGSPIDGVHVYLLDKGGRPTRRGEPGEIYIGGAGVARGYRHQPELTAERFVHSACIERGTERLYRTGDIGRWRPDGQLTYLGRSDRQVKVLGHRVEPEEIAAVLCQHPDVLTAAVLPDAGTALGALRSFVVPREGGSPTSEALSGFLSARLPAYMIPSRIDVVSSLPLTENGKLDRSAVGTSPAQI